MSRPLWRLEQITAKSKFCVLFAVIFSSRQSGWDHLFSLKTAFHRVKGTKYYICDVTFVGGGGDLVDSDLSPASSDTPSSIDKNDQLVELSKTYILAKNRFDTLLTWNRSSVVPGFVKP